MPIYRYRPIDPPCKLCGDGFDHSQKASDPELSECPTCGKNVKRVLPAEFGTLKRTEKQTISRAKNSGFTVLKKISDGEYEKQ